MMPVLKQNADLRLNAQKGKWVISYEQKTKKVLEIMVEGMWTENRMRR